MRYPCCAAALFALSPLAGHAADPTLPYQYPPGGTLQTRAGTSILVPNPSGFANLATGLAVTMGCPPNPDGTPGLLRCLAGVNGGYSTYDPATGRNSRTAEQVQQAIIAYGGGVDMVGAYVSVGPLGAPLNIADVTIDGPRGTRLTWPAGHRPPGDLLRPGTFIRTTTLTSTLVSYIVAVADDGASVTVIGWCAPYAHDPRHGQIDIDPNSVAKQPGQASIGVDVGFVTHGFGANIVGGVGAGGPQEYTAGEVDVSNETGKTANLEEGWTVNGVGNGQMGLGMGINGSLRDGGPAFIDGMDIGGCGYRCLYVNMDHDGTPAHHAIAGLYLQARYNLPIVLYNDSGRFPAEHGNVLTVDAGGSMVTQGSVTSLVATPQPSFVAAPAAKGAIGYAARMADGLFADFVNTVSNAHVLQIGAGGGIVSTGGVQVSGAPSTLASARFTDPEPGVARDLKLGATGLAAPVVHLSGVSVAQLSRTPCEPGDVMFAADARNAGEPAGEGSGALAACNSRHVWLAAGRPVTN